MSKLVQPAWVKQKNKPSFPPPTEEQKKATKQATKPTKQQ